MKEALNHWAGLIAQREEKQQLLAWGYDDGAR
jgi:hypothetical protein